MAGDNGGAIPTSSIHDLSHMVTMLSIVHFPIETATRYQCPEGLREHVEVQLRECPGQVSRHLRELSALSGDERFSSVADMIDEHIIEHNLRKAGESGPIPHPSPEL